MTPEGRIKGKIKKAIKAMQAEGYPVYYHMPVQNGMGAPSLDFIGCADGRYFGIEAKAPGQSPTKRQELTMDEIGAAGGATFVISDEEGIRHFAKWVGNKPW